MFKTLLVSILPVMILTTLSFFGFSSLWAEENEVSSCVTRLLSKRSLRYYNAARYKAPTVHFAGELKGSHGGLLSILEVPDGLSPSWASQYQVQPRAPQGDPRQVVSLLGAQLAYFFGIREIDDLKITIPDVKEISGALAKLNRALIELGYEPIPISFYLQENADRNSYFYITSFYEKGLLPMAPSGILRVHDVSYHLGSIVLPRALLGPVMEKYRRAIEFYHFAQDRSVDELTRTRFEKYLNVLDMKIDVGLGNIPSAFVKRTRYEFSSLLMEEIQRKYKTEAERSAEQAKVETRFLQSWLNDSWKTLTFNGENEPGLVDLALREAMKSDFSDVETIWKIYDAFWRQQRFQGFKEISASVPSGEEIYAQIRERHAQLVKALAHIKKKESQ